MTDAATTKRYLYTPETCPSKHWNPGDDICSDCGVDLNCGAPPPDLRGLLQEAVDEWPEFGTDADVNGSDLVEWFGGWIEQVKVALATSLPAVVPDFSATATAKYKDGDVIGREASGALIQWSGLDAAPYTSGETLDEFGIDNLSDEERRRLGLPETAHHPACPATDGIGCRCEEILAAK